MSEEQVPYETHGNPEIRIVPNKPDTSNDTETVKKIVELTLQIKELWKTASKEEQDRLDEIGEALMDD